MPWILLFRLFVSKFGSNCCQKGVVLSRLMCPRRLECHQVDYHWCTFAAVRILHFRMLVTDVNNCDSWDIKESRNCRCSFIYDCFIREKGKWWKFNLVDNWGRESFWPSYDTLLQHSFLFLVKSWAVAFFGELIPNTNICSLHWPLSSRQQWIIHKPYHTSPLCPFFKVILNFFFFLIVLLLRVWPDEPTIQGRVTNAIFH